MASRGRPFPPGNKQGRGRPRGSRNKSTLLAQQLLESHSEALTRKVLLMALNGDAAALRLSLERILPVRREAPVKLGRFPVATAADVSKSMAMVLHKMASGNLTVGETERIAALLEQRRQTIQTEELEGRLRLLESRK